VNARPLVCLLLAAAPFAACAAPACVRDFDAFMARFEADRAFQRAQSIQPLPYSVSEPGAADRPVTRVRQLLPAEARTLDEIEFPGPQAREARGLLEARQCTHPSACVIALDNRADERQSLRFSFAQRRGCWRLVGIARIGA
jgi:hypothetical protein